MWPLQMNVREKCGLNQANVTREVRVIFFIKH